MRFKKFEKDPGLWQSSRNWLWQQNNDELSSTDNGRSPRRPSAGWSMKESLEAFLEAPSKDSGEDIFVQMVIDSFRQDTTEGSSTHILETSKHRK